MPKMDYFAEINRIKAEKAALIEQADQLIADKKFGTELEDVQNKMFTRDELQQGAPETMDGYWQVPRLVD